MREINFDDEWYNMMVNLAARQPRMQELARWLLLDTPGVNPRHLEIEARAVCKSHTLTIETDLVDVIECYEDGVNEGLLDAEA